LGTIGYKGQVEKRMRQQLATAPEHGSAQGDLYDGLDERSYNWIRRDRSRVGLTNQRLKKLYGKFWTITSNKRMASSSLIGRRMP